MMRFKINVMMIFIVSVGFGCRGTKVKTKLTNTELKWMDVYNTNDTLVFKSQYGEFDTSIIIKKELFYSENNSVSEPGKQLNQWGVVWYKNKNLKYHPDGYRLITLLKKYPTHITSLSINYLYSDFLFLDIRSDSILKAFNAGVYHFKSNASRVDALRPKEVFWDERNGIVKYITYSSDVWIRINLPK